MEVLQVVPGLWRWTVPAADGGERAGTYYEAPGAVVLIDPVAPADGADAERFRRALDRDVARLGRPVAVLVTTPAAAEAALAVGAPYGAAPGPPPAGVEACPAGPGAVAYWLAAPRALVAADRGGAAEALRRSGHPADRVLVARGAPVLEGGPEAVARALA